MQSRRSGAVVLPATLRILPGELPLATGWGDLRGALGRPELSGSGRLGPGPPVSTEPQ